MSERQMMNSLLSSGILVLLFAGLESAKVLVAGRDLDAPRTEIRN